MNAPFRDLLASYSLFANSEWDERMSHYRSHVLFSQVGGIKFYFDPTDQNFSGIFFPTFLDLKVDFGQRSI